MTTLGHVKPLGFLVQEEFWLYRPLFVLLCSSIFAGETALKSLQSSPRNPGADSNVLMFGCSVTAARGWSSDLETWPPSP